MKSKAALFLDEAAKEYDIEDYIPDAVKWWSKLAPKLQKEWLSKLPPDKIASIYQDLYGPVPKAQDKHEDNTLKKVLKAAVIAAFLASGGAAHAADYSVHSTSTHTPTKQQQEYSRQMQQQDKQDQEKKGPSLSDIANVGAAAVNLYGTARTQQRVSRASNDVNFIIDALKVLTGNN